MAGGDPLVDFKEEVLKRLEALEAAVRDLRGSRISKNGKSRPASYEEVEEYITGNLKLTKNDACALWEHWEGNGFKNGGKVMASWKATASNWERRKIFFPSLQRERPRMELPHRR